MTPDQWAREVRAQMALGLVLPLGGPADPAWIVESAAADVLRAAACGVEGARLGAAHLDTAGPGEADRGAPPGAVPRVPLLVRAAFEVVSGSPIPVAADRLRQALWQAADDRLGLDVAAVDLTVTGLLESDTPGDGEGNGDTPEGAAAAAPGDGKADTPGNARTAAPGDGNGGVAAAVLAVPGVAGLSSRLGGFPPGVRVRDTAATAEITVSAGFRALDVALGVRDALVAACGAGTVTVVVTDVAGT